MNIRNLKQYLKVGDGLVIIMSLLGIFILFQTFWSHTPASKVEIRVGEKILGIYSLNQTRDITVHGKLGDALIRIEQGQARFVKSPCQTQYCVLQGWLHHEGHVAICLPNQISLTLLGEKKLYDSLNY